MYGAPRIEANRPEKLRADARRLAAGPVNLRDSPPGSDLPKLVGDSSTSRIAGNISSSAGLHGENSRPCDASSGAKVREQSEGATSDPRRQLPTAGQPQG